MLHINHPYNNFNRKDYFVVSCSSYSSRSLLIYTLKRHFINSDQTPQCNDDFIKHFVLRLFRVSDMSFYLWHWWNNFFDTIVQWKWDIICVKHKPWSNLLNTCWLFTKKLYVVQFFERRSISEYDFECFRLSF